MGDNSGKDPPAKIAKFEDENESVRYGPAIPKRGRGRPPGAKDKNPRKRRKKLSKAQQDEELLGMLAENLEADSRLQSDLCGYLAMDDSEGDIEEIEFFLAKDDSECEVKAGQKESVSRALSSGRGGLQFRQLCFKVVQIAVVLVNTRFQLVYYDA